MRSFWLRTRLRNASTILDFSFVRHARATPIERVGVTWQKETPLKRNLCTPAVTNPTPSSASTKASTAGHLAAVFAIWGEKPALEHRVMMESNKVGHDSRSIKTKRSDARALKFTGPPARG